MRPALGPRRVARNISNNLTPGYDVAFGPAGDKQGLDTKEYPNRVREQKVAGQRRAVEHSLEPMKKRKAKNKYSKEVAALMGGEFRSPRLTDGLKEHVSLSSTPFVLAV